jgi:diacylglycerol kinase family enzyme
MAMQGDNSKKVAILLHNPSSGDEEHSKKELISTIEATGFRCKYSSPQKNNWMEIDPDVDFLIAAGGDGTVRSIVKQLLRRNVLEKSWPIALLPLGTANNVAKALDVSGSTEEIVQSWHHSRLKSYDVGVYNAEKCEFFLEGYGYGVFPYLMQVMNKSGKESVEDPEARLIAALETLHEITLSYKPRTCRLEVDGVDYSGNFLLAEIMNTRSIGPNLLLSPHADPGDGALEVVLVPEKHKERFLSYIVHKMNVGEDAHLFHTMKAKKVRISWAGTHVHVDDEILKLRNSAEVAIEIRTGLLQFLVPVEK